MYKSCASTNQKYLRLCCVIMADSATNPKCSTLQAARKEISIRNRKRVSWCRSSQVHHILHNQAIMKNFVSSSLSLRVVFWSWDVFHSLWDTAHGRLILKCLVAHLHFQHWPFKTHKALGYHEAFLSSLTLPILLFSPFSPVSIIFFHFTHWVNPILVWIQH